MTVSRTRRSVGALGTTVLLAAATLVSAAPAAYASSGVPMVDVNKDGWEDIAVLGGDSFYLRLSDGNGGADGAWRRYPLPTHPTEPGAPGESLTTCDLNADGFSDVVVGLPRYRQVAGAAGVLSYGAVAVYLGGAQLGSPRILRQGADGIPGADEGDDWFGVAVACGKVGSDRYADILVGAPGEDWGSLVNPGAAVLIRGSSGGIASSEHQGISQDSGGVEGSAESGDEFGRSVALGDVTGDGLAELLITAPLENGGANGILHSLKGSSSGWTGTGSVAVTGTVVGSPDQEMGTSLVVGRFDGSGALDVAVGSAGQDYAGRVAVFRGRSSNLSTSAVTILDQSSSGVPGVSEAGDMWGLALTAGDLNGDGYDDLAVGAPAEDTPIRDSGAVTVLRGSSSGLSASGATAFNQDSTAVPGVGEELDGFGSGLGIADVTGDRRPDLVIGTPGEAIGSTRCAGLVTVLPGSSKGVTKTGALSFTATSVGGTVSTWGLFGRGAPRLSSFVDVGGF